MVHWQPVELQKLRLGTIKRSSALDFQREICALPAQRLLLPKTHFILTAALFKHTQSPMQLSTGTKFTDYTLRKWNFTSDHLHIHCSSNKQNGKMGASEPEHFTLFDPKYWHFTQNEKWSFMQNIFKYYFQGLRLAVCQIGFCVNILKWKIQCIY